MQPISASSWLHPQRKYCSIGGRKKALPLHTRPAPLASSHLCCWGDALCVSAPRHTSSVTYTDTDDVDRRVTSPGLVFSGGSRISVWSGKRCLVVFATLEDSEFQSKVTSPSSRPATYRKSEMDIRKDLIICLPYSTLLKIRKSKLRESTQDTLTAKKKKKKKKKTKKHSENADTSTSVTFDMWLWPSNKVKTAYIFNITLSSWQRWCLSILVNTCLYPSGDILCQRKNSIFIRSIFSKAVQKL